MRTITLFFLLISSGLLLAQSDRFTGYGIDLFPHYSNRRLVVFDFSDQARIDSLETNETARPSYGIGAFLSYRGEKVGLRFGASYLNAGYARKREDIPFTDPFASKFSEVEYRFVSHQIEVPFSILFYQQLSDKDEFFFLLGTGASFNVSNKDIYTRYEGSTSEKEILDAPQGFRRLNFCLETGMGWEHKLGQELAMSIAPVFKLWLAGLYKEPLMENRNLYQLGLKVAFKIDRKIEYID